MEEKDENGIASARRALEEERVALTTRISELTGRLEQVNRALSVLDELENPPPPPDPPKRPHRKPTATIEECVEVIQEILAGQPNIRSSKLRKLLSERMVEMGRSRIALHIRVSQALSRLGIELD